jgi:hypothetical protein
MRVVVMKPKDSGYGKGTWNLLTKLHGVTNQKTNLNSHHHENLKLTGRLFTFV